MDSTGQNTDFGALFEANLAKLQTNFNVGDRIEGVITSIGRSTVFIDVGGRSDGLLDVAQVLDDEGKPTVSVGDTLTAYCLGSDEEGIRLTTKISGQVADAALGDAYEGGIPLEGKVAAERKGGYEVELQNHKAFCPYSQIDIFKREPAAYIGERFAFIISEYSENGRNLVVSRRRLLEKEMEEQKARLRETLAPGDLLTGIVTRVVEFGAFVDIGGTEGLIHVSELSWSRTSDPADVVSEGQSVEIKVLTVDWENNRISLSLKQTQPGPWDRVESGESFRVGMSWQGKITKIMPFGAFVELEPGLEGLIHISKLGGGRRINSPEEVVKEGEEVEVTIENIDVERQRIGLAMDNNYGGYDMTDPSGGMGVDLRPGATVTGIADGIKPFGVFIRFPGDKTGLLHISQIELKGSSNPMRALHDMFPPGKEVEVIVQKMEGTRISLTLASTLAREDDHIDLKSAQDSDGGSLGSLGDLFGGLDL